ncbi:hypothetical protein [Actinoplanes cyaneus]|uniref:hypothetical protein n=1 Tax=Actinoplanes cyaneus TaxID=52696 RepID=UPI001941F782|nr:hypothetical protein [Actinoplanes cyaneus]
MVVSRQRRWIRSAIATGGAGTIVTGTAVAVLAANGLKAGDVISLCSLVLAGTVALVSVMRWMLGRARSVPRTEGLADRLRQAVRAQWAEEASARRISRPEPLRLSWRPTTRPVAVASTGRHGQGSLLRGPGESRPAAHQLVTFFRDDPRRQLVILGDPGAGKTTTAILYVLASADLADGPAPVLLSAGGWDPAERVEDWAARRIQESYPEFVRGPDAVLSLIESGHIELVLDGLDEMPNRLLPDGLQDLDRAACSGVRMVLTCRGAEFEAAVGEAGPLSRAAVVEIEPVEPADVAAFLTQPEVDGSTRWDTVLTEIRRAPDGPLATALRTPLMIALARRVYHRASPAALTELATTDDVRDHLLDGFLAGAYPNPGDAERARGWLAFLARHLRDEVQDPNYRWWELPRAVPRTTIAVLVALAITIIGLAGGPPLVAFLTGGSAYDGTGVAIGSISGLGVGVLCGLNVARTVHSRGGPTVAATVLVAVSDVLVAALVVVPLAAVVTKLMRQADRHAGEMMSSDADFFRADGLFLVLAFVVGGLLMSAVIQILSAGRDGPRATTPRLRTMRAGLNQGIVAATIVGVALYSLSPTGGELSIAGTAGLITGLIVTVGRGLVEPATDAVAVSPDSLLRSDRTALLLTTGLVAAGTAAIGYVLCGNVNDAWVVVPFLIMGCAAIVVFFGSGSLWFTYSVARLWLAANGQLPWRLARFLREAREAGVLRQAGPAYQFRHDLISAHLAGPPDQDGYGLDCSRTASQPPGADQQ